MNDIRVEISDHIAVVTLDRPPVNAITLDHYQAIGETFEEIGRNRDVVCAVFTAAGDRAFCAGLDLQEFLAATVEEDPHRAEVVRTCFTRVRRCEVPVIAAVNGPALGAGAVLTAVCDFRIASTAAKFSMPEVNIGRCGGGRHLGRLIGQGQLRKLAFTGLPIDAAEALRIGLVEEVVVPEMLMPRALELARIIASKSAIGLRTMKQSLNEIELMPIEEGYQHEQGFSTQLMSTHDAREAIRAVAEKRKPVFLGH